jgi:hypothetical protein
MSKFEDEARKIIREVLLKSGQYSNTSYMKPDLGAWRSQLEALHDAHLADQEALLEEIRLFKWTDADLVKKLAAIKKERKR